MNALNTLKMLATRLEHKPPNYYVELFNSKFGSNTIVSTKDFSAYLKQLDSGLLQDTKAAEVSFYLSARSNYNDQSVDFLVFKGIIDDFINAKDLVQKVQHKILQAFDKNKRGLFKQLEMRDSKNDGIVDLATFNDCFKRECGQQLIENELTAVSIVYAEKGDSESGKINYVELQKQFDNYISTMRPGTSLNEMMAGKGSSDLQKMFFIYLENYMRRMKLNDPKDYFNMYGRDIRNHTISNYGFQAAVNDLVPADQRSQFDFLGDSFLNRGQIDLSLLSQKFYESKKEITADDRKQIKFMTSYNHSKTFIYYKICEKFIESGVDMQAELRKKNNYIAGISSHVINEGGFLELMNQNGIDLADFDQGSMGIAFTVKGEQPKMYDITELIGYYETMKNQKNETIGDRSQSEVAKMLIDLVEYLIQNKVCFFKDLLQQDEQKDGILTEKQFLNVAKFIQGRIYESTIALIRSRYTHNIGGKINYLSLMFDMYQLRKKVKRLSQIGDFYDLPSNLPPVDPQTVLFKLTDFMKKQNINSETMVSDLIDLGGSKKIKMSTFMLKVMDIMQSEICKTRVDAQSHTSNTLTNTSTGVQLLFDIVSVFDNEESSEPINNTSLAPDLLDPHFGKGYILDFKLVTKLNTQLNYEVFIFFKSLLSRLDREKQDFKSFISETITDESELVSIGRLKDLLYRLKFSEEGINSAFKDMKLDDTTQVHIAKLQTKFEKEMCLLEVSPRPEIIKAKIWGNSNLRYNLQELGVDGIITKIYESLKQKNQSFDSYFEIYSDRKSSPTMTKDYFSQKIKALGWTDYPQLNILFERCKSKSNPNYIDIATFKLYYDSKYGVGGTNSQSSVAAVQNTIENIRKTIQNMGFSLNTLFSTFDKNNTNSLDRRELYFLLFQLDDTIKQEESNIIFDMLDRDKSGSIQIKEFELFFRVDPRWSSNSEKVDKLKWAAEIFFEANQKLDQSHKNLQELCHNYNNSSEISLYTFRRIFTHDLGVETYKRDMNAARRLEEELTVPGKSDTIDYQFLSQCLRRYKMQSTQGTALHNIIRGLLRAWKNDAQKLVEFINIDNDNNISRAEFKVATKKIVTTQRDDDIDDVFNIITKSDSAKSITIDDFKNYLLKFQEEDKGEFIKKEYAEGTQAAPNLFAQVRHKISNFFGNDSYRFRADLQSFDRTGKNKIRFSDLTYYFEFHTLKLTAQEESTLLRTFKVVRTDWVDIDYVTSMIFYGKADMRTIENVMIPAPQQVFIDQIKIEMNIRGIGSFNLFSEFDTNYDRMVSREEFYYGCTGIKSMMLSDVEIEELFSAFANGNSFSLKDFRRVLYGKELKYVGATVFRVSESMQNKGSNYKTEFMKWGQQELTFESFAKVLSENDPLLKYDQMDIIFSKADIDNDGKVSSREIERLFVESEGFSKFKNMLVVYCKRNGSNFQDVLNLVSASKEINYDEFSELCNKVSEGSLPETEIRSLWSVLDRDNSNSLSKTELAEVLEITKKDLFNLTEFKNFKSYLMYYCDTHNITLKQIFDRFQIENFLTRSKLGELVTTVMPTANENTVQVLMKGLDKNWDKLISLAEFKDCFLEDQFKTEELVACIRRILFGSKTNIDELFNRYDKDKNQNLDFAEFKNFIRNLNLNLNYIELESFFDFLADSDGVHISRTRLYQVIYTQEPLDANMMKYVDEFKRKFNSNPDSQNIFYQMLEPNTNQLTMEAFIKYAKLILVNPNFGQAQAISIFKNIDYRQQKVLDYAEIRNFCQSSSENLEAKKLKDVHLQDAQINLKNYLKVKNQKLKMLFIGMNKDKKLDLVRREDFTRKLAGLRYQADPRKKEQNVLEPSGINVLANTYKPQFSMYVDIGALERDLENMMIDASGKVNLIISVLASYTKKNRFNLNDIFEQNSINGIMDHTRLVALLNKAGLSDPAPDMVNSFMEMHNPNRHLKLDIFQFFSAFDQELALDGIAHYLRDDYTLMVELIKWSTVRSSTLRKEFSACRTVETFRQELDKISELQRFNTKSLAEKFNSAYSQGEFDINGLSIVESHIVQNREKFSDFARRAKMIKNQFKPEELASLKKFLTELDTLCKKATGKNLESAAKVYDINKNSIITNADFFDKLVAKDIKYDAKKQSDSDKNFKLITNYAKVDERHLNYQYLCQVINESTESAGVNFQTEGVQGDRSNAPGVSNPPGQQPVNSSSPVVPPLANINQTQDNSYVAAGEAKNKIISYYRNKGMAADQIIDSLVPTGKQEIQGTQLVKNIKTQIPDIDEAGVNELFKTTINSYLTRKDIRDILFETMKEDRNLRNAGIDDQIKQVFTAVCTNGQTSINSESTRQALKLLGINKSVGETEEIYKQFLNPNSATLDYQEFSSLVKYEYSKEVMKERIIKERLLAALRQVTPRQSDTITINQVEKLIENKSINVSREELTAIHGSCISGAPEQGQMDAEKFVRMIANTNMRFHPNQRMLENGVIKLRTGLSTNLADHYYTFKDMPSSFVESFSENMYQNDPHSLPTSTLRPTLSESKFNYSHLFPPVAGQEANTFSRVGSS